MSPEFPAQQAGVNYLTEGGQETEIMYKYGFDLPHFAMFPLLDNPNAMAELHGMYSRYPRDGRQARIRRRDGWPRLPGQPGLGIAARVHIASRWPRCKCGPSTSCATWPRPTKVNCPQSFTWASLDLAATHTRRTQTITADEAEEYHGVQLGTLARADVGLVEAMTFNGIPEVVGLARAAAHAKLPLAVSFTLDHDTRRLPSGPIPEGRDRSHRCADGR